MINTVLIAGGGLGVGVLLLIVFVVIQKHNKRHTTTDAKHVSTLTSDLRSEREKSEIIINTIDDGVMLLDKERVIRLFNPAAANISGWPADEAIGIDYHNVLKFVNEKGEEILPEQSPIEQGLARTASYRDNNANLLTRAKKVTALSISVSPLTNKNGAQEGAVAIFRDVTNERNEEKQRSPQPSPIVQ